MDRDVIGTLYVLGVVMWLGWELHKRLTAAPQVVYMPAPVPHAEHNAAQVLCRCPTCAPTFLQESPPGEH